MYENRAKNQLRPNSVHAKTRREQGGQRFGCQPVCANSNLGATRRTSGLDSHNISCSNAPSMIIQCRFSSQSAVMRPNHRKCKHIHTNQLTVVLRPAAHASAAARTHATVQREEKDRCIAMTSRKLQETAGGRVQTRAATGSRQYGKGQNGFGPQRSAQKWVRGKHWPITFGACVSVVALSTPR